MKFIINEGGWSMLERFTYRGAIGLFYESTIGGMLAYLIFAILIALAAIGLVTVLKWLFTGRKKKRQY